MKKLTLIVALFAMSTGAFSQSLWRWGLTIGSIDNGSRFSGGMPNAAAVFSHTSYPGGEWGVFFRREMCPHFSIRAGLNFVGLGFQYAMAQDYSLTQPFANHNVNKVD